MTKEEQEAKIKEHNRLSKMLLYNKLKAEGKSPRTAWVEAGFKIDDFILANYAEGSKETQFKKGQPPPTAKRSTIYMWFGRYMELSEDELKDLDKDRLSGNQTVALQIVLKVREGEWPAVRHMLDRELGRPRQEVSIKNDAEMKVVGSPFAINNPK